MACFTRTDGYCPVRQFFLQFSLDRGKVTGNDQFTVLDLVGYA